MVKRIYLPSVLAFCAFIASACTPTIEERQFLCNMDEPCPDGFACFSGVCCTSAAACGGPEEDAGADAEGVDAPMVDSGVDAPLPDAGSDTFVEPDVPGCMAIDPATITSSMSAAGLVTLQLSAAAFSGLSGDADVSGAGINVQSATFGGGVLTLAYRAPRSVSMLPAGGTETISLTVTQTPACFQMNQGLPVTLGLQEITPNDESSCRAGCRGQSVDVASNGTVAFSTRDTLDDADRDSTSDIYMEAIGENLVMLSERWSDASQYVRIADDGTAVVYSPGTGRVVSQATTTPYATDDLARNCVIGGTSWCSPSSFAPVEIMTSPTRVAFLESLSPGTGNNRPSLVRRTGVPDGVVLRGNPFIDIQVNGRVWGFAQEGRILRAVDAEEPTEILWDSAVTTNRGFFPGIEEDDGVFQRGTNVVVARAQDDVYTFNNSTFLGASADLNRVLVVQDNSLVLLQSADGTNYDAIPIQDQSAGNVLTNLPLADVDKPAALSGNGAWIGALLGSPTHVVRIRVE